MSLFIILLSLLGFLILLLIAVGKLLPLDWTIEEAELMKGQPAAIFEWINQLEKWSDWTYWNAENGYTVSTVPNHDTSNSNLLISSSKLEAVITLTKSDHLGELHYKMSVKKNTYVLDGILLLSASNESFTQLAWRCTLTDYQNSRIFHRYQIFFLKKYIENAIQESLLQLQKILL